MTTETIAAKTAKHTPGPWQIDGTFAKFGHEWNIVRVALPGDDRWVAVVCIDTSDGGNNTTDIEQQQANAHLIAAAPDLLEALKGLLAEVDEMTMRCGWAGNGFRAKSRASLAKAERR